MIKDKHWKGGTMGIHNNKRKGIHKILAIFLISFMTLFLLIGTLTSFHPKYQLQSNSIKQWATNFSGETLVYIFGSENRYYTQVLSEESKPPSLPTVLFELATNIKPNDPRTLLGRELPGFAFFDSEIIIAGQGTDYTTLPIESPPPLEELLAERDAVYENIQEDENDIDTPTKTTNGKKVIYIIHTHDTESYLPHLPNASKPNQAYHSNVNITLVGERLASEFERRGIGALVEKTNMAELLKIHGKQFRHSYDIARPVIKQAMGQNDDIAFILDLHRDAHRRDKTTVTIDGLPYARTFFVLGGEHENYEKNEQMAIKLHELLQARYPGLSRGSVVRKGRGVNGIYNQDLSQHSILIEIGGVDNTLEETYRTASALADVISDYYWELNGAEKQ
jgi:stage II sporulation protein P